ncbi:MAG: hypothetical protein PF541_16080 [Prolixibacteraceae bacterium]|nr:hypothetical protein [Prolixibacteraceae bacterium]
MLGISPKETSEELAEEVSELSEKFHKSKVFSTWAALKTNDFIDGINIANQAYQGSFIKPNIIFLNMINRDVYSGRFNEIIEEAARLQIGVLIYSQHLEYGLGERKTINVWIRNRAPNWKISWDIGNLDLSILVAHKLQRNWKARIRLVTVVENEEQKEQASKFMDDLIDQARLPKTEVAIYVDNFNELIKKSPAADLNIFGLEANPNFGFMDRMVAETQTTCLFIRDSGLENIFA